MAMNQEPSNREIMETLLDFRDAAGLENRPSA